MRTILSRVLPIFLVLMPATVTRAQNAQPTRKPTVNPANRPLEAPPATKPTPVRSSYRVYDDYDRFGFYIGGGASYAFEFFKDNPPNLEPTNGWAMNFRGGYRFDPNWAAELHLEYYFGEFEFEKQNPKDARGADRLRLDGVNVTADAKWYILYRRIQPYLVGGPGVGFWHLEEAHDRDTSWEVGLIVRGGPGVDFYLTRDLVLTAEVNYVYPLPFGDIEDYHTLNITFGGGFRF